MEPKEPTQESKKSYSPQEIEKSIYDICLNRGYFEIDGNKNIQHKDSFSIMMPPPNVTGVLHIGHALTLSLQDIITRYKRMDGYKTLYQPGLDHAGIATQNVVEKKLLAQGITKESLGREKFIEKVWQWKEQSGGEILSQMKHLGISAAWHRTRFTMDDGLQKAVKKAFVKWYQKGLIVRGNYMVNWCTHDGALSDIEVEYKPSHSKLYHLRYFIDKDSYIVVATTRPETYFGDSAVMVNPNDERYAHLVGKAVELPLCNRQIPIIADAHVDISFGSGAVKVTPAHDINDYEVGKRHNLEQIVVFDKNGILNERAGEFQGLERLEAREKIVAKLESLGFVEKIQDYENQIGVCYRCGNTIEQYISKQWFVKAEVAKNAIEKVNNDEVRFYPASWKNNYNAWMRELRDWCISRQLWWGHRIPVWYCECGEIVPSETDHPKCPKCSQIISKQDEDVLDTWFSSGLWAFSTLGWGDDAKSDLFNPSDLKDFYPNSLLITGFDILFFWVARMLLSGESLLGELPFKDIYLHALVRDENNEKMSKSKGNVIDPLSIIQTHGADSLRFSLAILCAQGRDVRLSHAQLDISKNFANKLFNATNFLLLNHDKFASMPNISSYKTPLGIYMKSRLNLATKEIRNALDTYRFNDGASILYKFLWQEFCDWGIELSKADKDSIIELGAVFKDALKLLHPYMPFVTEDLWHKLNGSNIQNDDSIMISPYPKESIQDANMTREFDVIKDVIISLRRAKATIELGNSPLKLVYITLKESMDLALLEKYVKKLAKVESIILIPNANALNEKCVRDVSDLCECFLPLGDVDLSAISKRLESQKVKLEKEIAKLEGMLENKNFIANAPKEVLQSSSIALQDAKDKYAKVISELENIS